MSVQIAPGGPSVTELSWLAGYIDGDGSISMRACSTSRSTRFRYPVLTIDSCDPELLEEVRRITGQGRVKGKPRKRQSKSHRDCWTWLVNGAQVVLILEKVTPYLRCEFKRRRATLLIENKDLYTKSKGKKFNEEESARRYEIERLFFTEGENRGSRNRAYSVSSSKRVAVAEVKTLVQI